MPTARAAVTVHCGTAETERAWYDTARWPQWVDGCEALIDVAGDWPRPGAAVHWRSLPAGRGSVSESVAEYEAGVGQVVQVTDDSIDARQTVMFDQAPEGTEVALALDYRIRKRSIATPLLEALFVTRAIRASLEATLQRFAAVAIDSPH